MTEETWDLYDTNCRPTGQTVTRGEPIRKGFYHIVVHMWFLDSRGYSLIQQRNKPDDGTDGLWFVTGGAALAGETSIGAAVRETEEELGLTLAESDFQHVERVHPADDDYILDIWCSRWNGELGSLEIDPGEVRAVKWASCNDIAGMMDDGTFWSLSDEYLSKLREWSSMAMPLRVD